MMLVVLCTALQRPPVFRVTEAASSAPVTLIGVMHYNPSSVAVVTTFLGLGLGFGLGLARRQAHELGSGLGYPP